MQEMTRVISGTKKLDRVRRICRATIMDADKSEGPRKSDAVGLSIRISKPVLKLKRAQTMGSKQFPLSLHQTATVGARLSPRARCQSQRWIDARSSRLNRRGNDQQAATRSKRLA